MRLMPVSNGNNSLSCSNVIVFNETSAQVINGVQMLSWQLVVCCRNGILFFSIPDVVSPIHLTSIGKLVSLVERI